LSAETEKLFRSLLKDLRPLFKESGFRASSQNFILESAECWVIVNFQKSRWGNRDETTFYVNVAACSKRWHGIQRTPADKVPPFYSCDWRWRVEQFGPDKSVQQWTLSDEDSLQVTLGYLQILFRDFLLPAAITMTTEAGLLKHSGGFEHPQLKTRAVILAATNQVSALKQTVSTLIEKFGSGIAGEGTREHLEMLRSKYPEAMRGIELPQSRVFGNLLRSLLGDALFPASIPLPGTRPEPRPRRIDQPFSVPSQI
jgi:Domain of unknown function (DUF4304)